MKKICYLVGISLLSCMSLNAAAGGFYIWSRFFGSISGYFLHFTYSKHGQDWQSLLKSRLEDEAFKANYWIQHQESKYELSLDNFGTISPKNKGYWAIVTAQKSENYFGNAIAFGDTQDEAIRKAASSYYPHYKFDVIDKGSFEVTEENPESCAIFVKWDSGRLRF